MTYPWITAEKKVEDEYDEDKIAFYKEVARTAAKELREDKSTREQSLQQMREWIKRNRDLENCRTDDSFLLRFLRAKKFSIPMAQQMILKYLNLRQTFPHMVMNLDFLSPKLNKLINDGYIIVSPFRDDHGRRVIFHILRNFDPYKFSSAEMGAMHALAYETLVDNEEDQVMGFTHVGDLSGASMSLISLWSPNEFATVVKWGEQSFPMRHKSIHLLHLPGAFKYVLDFARGRFSSKINSRLTVHDSIKDLHTKVDPKVLPKEYGGTVPISVMIEKWKEEMQLKRDSLLNLDKMKLLSTQGIICRRNKGTHENGINKMCGSFRKLEVD